MPSLAAMICSLRLETASVRLCARIDILKAGCPNDLPSTPTGRLAAMESRLQVMLQAVQTVRPALNRFYQSLNDEQKARFNAVSAGDDSTAGEDQRDFTKFCDERTPGVTDLPIDRIAQAVQPTSAQRVALDEYDNEAAYQAHRNTEHFKKYAATTANMVAQRNARPMTPIAFNSKGH
jgi:hypothetical protein